VESDPDACEELFRSFAPRFPGRVHIVTGECGPSEVKGIIGLCEFFVGSRMHACIGALSQGIPTIGVAYSRKFQGVFESVGVGHLVVDARRGTEQHAIEAIFSAYYRKEQEREIIRERVAAAQTLLRQTFRDILGGPPRQGVGEPVPNVGRNADLLEMERVSTSAPH
jgi:polysaccharide pyruvyl transferase WcaK-like protein